MNDSNFNTEIEALQRDAANSFDKGDFVEARSKYQQLIKLQPSAENYNSLGMVAFNRQRFRSAVKNLLKASEINPHNSFYRVNLGMAYASCRDFDKARESYQSALLIEADCLPALNALGSLLYDLGQMNESETVFRRALLCEPKNADLLNNVANILKFRGLLDEAQELYGKSLQYQPQNANTLYNLACLHNSAGHVEQAKKFFERCLLLDEDNLSARHLLSAINGETPGSAPQQYMSELFDEYSSTFETCLTKQLQYDIPVQLHSLLLSYSQGKMPSFEHLLDMGCGTGLGGKPFKEQAKRLTGIDLSASMLSIAKSAKVYSELRKTDIATYLNEHHMRYDIFLACDVFIYIGALEEVFAAVSKRAEDNAYFLFSVESSQDASYILRSTGRYAQSAAYIHSLAKSYGWNIGAQKITGIRKDKGSWIDGMIFLLRKE